MEITEIILLIAGGIVFVLSFIIPEKAGKSTPDGLGKLAREEIKQLVGQEMEAVRGHVDEVVDEAVGYAMEKTERSLERLSNEKIMAVNEYSDTVLAEIHRNHEEAVFLYDMLNSKHANLKDTVSEVNRTVKEAEETVSSMRKPAEQSFVEIAESAEVISEPVRRTRKRETVGAKPAEEITSGRTKMAAESASTEIKKRAKSSGNKAVTEESKAVSESDETGASEDDGQNNNEKILELYKQGKSKVVIAKELGLGVGEVKLVIDLYKNR